MEVMHFVPYYTPCTCWPVRYLVDSIRYTQWTDLTGRTRLPLATCMICGVVQCYTMGYGSSIWCCWVHVWAGGPVHCTIDSRSVTIYNCTYVQVHVTFRSYRPLYRSGKKKGTCVCMPSQVTEDCVKSAANYRHNNNCCACTNTGNIT